MRILANQTRPATKPPARPPSALNQQRKSSPAIHGRGPQSKPTHSATGSHRPAVGTAPTRSGGWQHRGAEQQGRQEGGPIRGSGWQKTAAAQQSPYSRTEWPIKADPNTGEPLRLRGGGSPIDTAKSKVDSAQRKVNADQRKFDSAKKKYDEAKRETVPESAKREHQSKLARYQQDQEIARTKLQESQGELASAKRTLAAMQAHQNTVHNRFSFA